MALVMTLDYVKAEAVKGRRCDFAWFMNCVPDAPAAAGNKLQQYAVKQSTVACHT